MNKKNLRRPSEQISAILASNMRRLRKAKDLSQEELADIANLHRTYIGSVERSERNVTLSSLETIAKALDVSVIDLLTEDKSHD